MQQCHLQLVVHTESKWRYYEYTNIFNEKKKILEKAKKRIILINNPNATDKYRHRMDAVTVLIVEKRLHRHTI